MSTNRLQRLIIPRFSIQSLMWLSLVVAILLLWYRDHQALTEQLANRQYAQNGKNWSIDQILGKPNSTPFGDVVTAWASELADGQQEWVIVEFPSTIRAKQICIYETFNPGALSKIATVSMTGTEDELWSGQDPVFTTGPQTGVSRISLANPVETRRLKLFFNSLAVSGWNEIDAVGLIDERGTTHWASAAWASSSYGQNRVPPSWYWP